MLNQYNCNIKNDNDVKLSLIYIRKGWNNAKVEIFAIEKTAPSTKARIDRKVLVDVSINQVWNI